MKKIVITKYKEFGDQPEVKNIIALGGEEMEVSDGYHTFSELYEHRIALFIAFCREYQRDRYDGTVWRSKLHSDGSMLNDWFILGIDKEKGKQISYHLPLSKWDDVSFAETLEKAPEWDGHTPVDVLKRLKEL